MVADGPSPASRLRAIGGRLLLAVLALVPSLLVCEGVVRLFDLDRSPYAGRGLYQPDYDLGHVLSPGFDRAGLRTNSLGLRDRELTPQKPDGVYRIVGLGDSFAFGGADPEGIYLRVLEARLRAASRQVEVINAGVPAYSTLQEIGHLRKFGLKLGPDLVLLGLFVTGDVIENHADERLHVVDGELTTRPVSRLERILIHSRLYRFLRVRGIVAAGPRHEDFLRTERDRLRTCARRLRPDVRHGYEVTERALLELRDLTASRGIGLFVLLISDEVQVNPEVFAEAGRGGEFDLDQPNRRLAEVLVRNGIAFVDPLPALREAARREAVYIPDDTHLSPAGCRVVADALAEALLPRIPAARP